jgi:predicted ATPase/class 3 adenylate cyclase
VGRDLPDGTVTFLFTDIEGSTRLLHELGPKRYSDALDEHRRLLRGVVARHGGIEVDTEGDAFFIVFRAAGEALAAAAEAQVALAAGPVRVRMGIHTGTPHVTPEGYVGVDVHLAARVAAAAHGGQVILSKATRDALDEPVELLDLGEHRVKDFVAPVWIYQLGSVRLPPLRTLSNTNLPRPASSFVGRTQEVASIRGLLRDGARLVTLTGPGGTGKSRLAIEAAGELVASFRNGVFWVGLASLRDPGLVAEAIAETIGAKNGLAADIGEREMLLLLDNVEQVVAAAPELASLVESCPNLCLLVTSRERLRVRGEVELPIPPLAAEDAVALFTERAGLAPDETIRHLCQELDNLPLAVELAAARTSVLSPTQITARLSGRLDQLKGGRDADPRQATLRATIAWSHDLLTGGETTLFARLSVFRGGWTLDDAESICGADLDTLGSLVDKSLVRRAGERFTMLETIREYARERLLELGEAEALRGRHGEHFLALAEEAAREVIGAHPKAWIERLDDEHNNLRAALDRFNESGDVARSLQLAGALWGFWQVRGHFVEGRRRLDAALNADAIPAAIRARALLAWVSLAMESEPVEQTRAYATEALRIYESLGDRWGAAFARWRLGGIAAHDLDWGTARSILEQSRQEFRASGDAHHFLAVTRSVAWVTEELGDIPRYRELVEEYLAGARAIGDERLEARGLGARAAWALEEGQLDQSLADLKRSFEIDRGLGFVLFLAVDLIRFAAILVRQGRASQAAQLLARADLLATESGAGRESWMQKERDDTMALVRARLNPAELDEASSRGRNLTIDEAATLAIGAIPRSAT